MLHLRLLQQRRDVSVVGVTDADPSRATSAALDAGCRAYADVAALLDDVDAVVIATPHRQHAAAAVAALRRGAHVLCEKPLAASVVEADAIVAAARDGRGVFSMVFQSRFDPPLKRLRELVERGELGRVYSCHITEAGLRTRAYYRESPWRGTWRGEGGGVVVNQAPHVLDRYVWLVGKPLDVMARSERRLSDVETEDSCSLLLAHNDGVDGYIHVDTHTAPAISSHVLLCDGGRAELKDGRLRITQLRASIAETRLTSRESFAQLEGQTFDIPSGHLGAEELLAAQHDNFFAAVVGDAALVAPGVEGLASVELANAALLSAARRAPIALPLDRTAWSAFFAEKTGEPGC